MSPHPRHPHNLSASFALSSSFAVSALACPSSTGGWPPPTPKSSGDYVSAFSTSSYAHSLMVSFTLSSGTTDNLSASFTLSSSFAVSALACPSSTGGWPPPTPKSSGDYVSAFSTSSYAHSLMLHPFIWLDNSSASSALLGACDIAGTTGNHELPDSVLCATRMTRFWHLVKTSNACLSFSNSDSCDS
ncbi:hypothetical protein EV424DRAFT_1541450 [Suillus variegatus]|nr:hypothetical protein EV424DRAFT_1541450 [Suillus variegatus]